jgi:hypothetical protein
MCKKIVYLVSFVLVLALISNASAISWTNSDPADSLWDTPGNWSPVGKPTSSDAVSLAAVMPGPTIDSSTNAVCLQMLGPGQSGTTSMDINGGSLTTTSYWSIGQNPGSGVGTANVWNNATVTVGGDLYVGNQGNGTLNVGALGAGDNTYIITSAQLRVSHAASSDYGHVNLYSGTIDAYDLIGYHTGNDICIDIYEGTLIVRNKGGGPLQEGWIDKGYIIAYGGAGTVILEHDDITGWDTLTAIPEPATIALLSLGGLALIRRKR